MQVIWQTSTTQFKFDIRNTERERQQKLNFPDYQAICETEQYGNGDAESAYRKQRWR